MFCETWTVKHRRCLVQMTKEANILRRKSARWRKNEYSTTTLYNNLYLWDTICSHTRKGTNVKLNHRPPQEQQDGRNCNKPAAERSAAVAMTTHLHPLSVGLHVEDDAGVWFGQSVSVWDPFAGKSQLHFGETRAVEQAQRVGRRLVDVAHGGGGTGSLGRRRKDGEIRESNSKIRCKMIRMTY